MSPDPTPTTMQLAVSLHGLVFPYCELAQIAGSLRRGKTEAKDIELVVVPHYGDKAMRDLFGKEIPLGRVSLLDERLEALYLAGDWQLDRANPKNGPRYKRLRHARYGKAVDLFITTRESWGLQLAIRTGPAAFSKMLAARCKQRGYQMDDGQLWRVHNDGQREAVAVPTEQHFFALLALPWRDPAKRAA